MSTNGRRILYLFPGTLEPPTSGMHQRNKLLYRALCELGTVDTICLREKHEFVRPEEIDRMRSENNLIDVFDLPELGQRPPWAWFRPLSPKHVDRLARALGNPDLENRPVPALRDRLRRHVEAGGYDLIVARYFYRAAKAGVLEVHPHAIDVDDLQTEMLRTTLETKRSTGLAGFLQRRRLRRLSKRLPARFRAADLLFVANDEHQREPGLENAIYLPNIPYFEGVDTPPEPPPLDPESKTVLFVGSFGHPPNVEGIEHFMAHVWPKVYEAHPDARLMLVGSKMSESMKARYRQIPGVEPVGFVEHLRDAYAQAAFTVVPIYRGSGTNIKVPESLAYGRAVVLTPFALRGYRSVMGEAGYCRVVERDEAFACVCIDQLQKVAGSLGVVTAAHDQVRESLSFAALARRVKAVDASPLKEEIPHA